VDERDEVGLNFLKEWTLVGLDKAETKFAYYSQASTLFWEGKALRTEQTAEEDEELVISQQPLETALTTFEIYHGQLQDYSWLIKQPPRKKRAT
jgi:hypothetical protein